LISFLLDISKNLTTPPEDPVTTKFKSSTKHPAVISDSPWKKNDTYFVAKLQNIIFLSLPPVINSLVYKSSATKLIESV